MPHVLPLAPDTKRTAVAYANPQNMVREVLGYSAFRRPQEAIVNHVCRGGDAAGLMRTGGGK